MQTDSPTSEVEALRVRLDAGLPPIVLYTVDVTADMLPDGIRPLLAHDQGMTRTLEARWGEPMRLQVLCAEEADEVLRRTVLLSGAVQGRPAEIGIIQIRLRALPAPVRDTVRSGALPFGTVLKQAGIAFTSRPRGYLSVTPESRLCTLLEVPPGDALYGRTTVLRDADEVVLAEAVEIVAPVRR